MTDALTLESGRIHHPTRAVRVGTPVRSRFCTGLLKSNHRIRPAFDMHRVNKANVFRLAGHYQ